MERNREKEMRRIKTRYDAERLAQALPLMRGDFGLLEIHYRVEEKDIIAKGTDEDAVRKSFEKQYLNYFFHGKHHRGRHEKNKRTDSGRRKKDKNNTTSSV